MSKMLASGTAQSLGDTDSPNCSDLMGVGDRREQRFGSNLFFFFCLWSQKFVCDWKMKTKFMHSEPGIKAGSCFLWSVQFTWHPLEGCRKWMVLHHYGNSLFLSCSDHKKQDVTDVHEDHVCFPHHKHRERRRAAWLGFRLTWTYCSWVQRLLHAANSGHLRCSRVRCSVSLTFEW